MVWRSVGAASVDVANVRLSATSANSQALSSEVGRVGTRQENESGRNLNWLTGTANGGSRSEALQRLLAHGCDNQRGPD